VSKFKSFTTLSNLRTVEDISRYYSIIVDQLESILNGGIGFSDNLQSSISSVVFSTANSEVIVPHGLKVAPLGYVILTRSAALVVYDGSTEWTTEFISLKASASGTAKVMVIA